MYVNNRDQINYHNFLKNARSKSGASQSQVAAGLYTSSAYNRAELGVRIPEKLMRDRLTARLGFSGEHYVEYLGLEELQQWKQRQDIVSAIAEKDIETAETVLESYEKLADLTNTVQLQFIKSMRFFILQAKGASKEELLMQVQDAVRCTVANVDKALVGVHLLADQELNLIAESMRLQPHTGVVSDESTWRILEYQKLITYMDHSFMENLAKVKVYPKVTSFICKEVLKEGVSACHLRDAWKLCDTSLELLFDTHRLYYFIELLEYKKAILYRLQEDEMDDRETDEIEAALKETIILERKWKAYFKEYELPLYIEDSTYLYWETECYSAVEVLESRRKMLGLPRRTLCDGICTERSLIRIERTNLSPSMYILNNLFERMGLCAEYRRGTLVSWDTEVLNIYKELSESLNDFCKETSGECIEKLKKELCMELSFNQQEIRRTENLRAEKCNEFEKESFGEMLEDTLECTLPIWALYNQKGDLPWYYTRSELACIHDLAFLVRSEHSECCVEIIQNYCKKQMEYPIHPTKIATLELLLGGLISYLRTIGEEERAKSLRLNLFKSCLFYRRMPFALEHPEETQVMIIE